MKKIVLFLITLLFLLFSVSCKNEQEKEDDFNNELYINKINDILSLEDLDLPNGKIKKVDEINNDTIKYVVVKIEESDTDYNTYKEYIDNYFQNINYKDATRKLRFDRINNFNIYRSSNEYSKLSLYYNDVSNYYYISATYNEEDYLGESAIILFDYFNRIYNLNLSFLKDVKFIKSIGGFDNELGLNFEIYGKDVNEINKDQYYTYLKDMEKELDKDYIKTEQVYSIEENMTEYFVTSYYNIEDKDDVYKISNYYLMYSKRVKLTSDGKSELTSYSFSISGESYDQDKNKIQNWPSEISKSVFKDKVNIPDYQGNFITNVMSYGDATTNKQILRLFELDNSYIDEYCDSLIKLGFVEDENNQYVKIISEKYEDSLDIDYLASIKIEVNDKYTDFIYDYETIIKPVEEVVSEIIRKLLGSDVLDYIPIIYPEKEIGWYSSNILTGEEGLTFQVDYVLDDYYYDYKDLLKENGYSSDELDNNFTREVDGIGIIKIKVTRRPRPIEDQGRKDVLIGISIERIND